MKIPQSIYKAKDCSDLVDVEVALDALKDWCISFFKLSPDEVPAAKKRYIALLRLRVKFSK